MEGAHIMKHEQSEHLRLVPEAMSVQRRDPRGHDAWAVELVDVHKSYGRTVALDGITLSVGEGEIFGLLGPNGAGKTTLMKLLTGLLVPNNGSVRVFGLDPSVSGRRVRAASGYVMQQTTHDKYLSATQNLRMHAELFGMTRDQAARRVRGALDWAGLTNVADRPLATFSGGMQRRLDLAAIKLQQPRLTLLDEPTLGLDVQARRQVWDLVQALKDMGTTVIVTTHYIEEAERLCDHIAMIQHGRVVGFDTPEALRSRVLGERHRLEVEFDGEPDTWPDGLPLEPERTAPSTWCFEGQPGELFQVAAVLYDHLSHCLRGVRYIEPTLEEVFVRLTDDSYAALSS